MSNLFITHGGLGALKETIMYGVPALVIRFDKDQPENAARVAYHRLGYRREAGSSSPEELVVLVNCTLT
jgi:UDP:flavonoid glycosyltransferase YjiC (YdhE family)